MARASESHAHSAIPAESGWYVEAMEGLVGVVQELSHARSLDKITEITRHAARRLTGADGATFVLRDGDQCFYADEDAISPLWKGRRFPMDICISGWVMLNAEPAVIDDIYVDPRIPADAYRPTFVKSLAMVPIRRGAPIGAIGTYWAVKRMPTPEEVSILQALADTTSVAIENVTLFDELQRNVKALEESNYELSRFAWVASHDLQEPLRTIHTQLELLQAKNLGPLDEAAHNRLRLVKDGTSRLRHLIQSLLVHARAERMEATGPVDMAEIAKGIVTDLGTQIEETGAEIVIGDLPTVIGDPVLLGRVLQNLISNAIKFQAPGSRPSVKIDSKRSGDEWVISVTDNGIGIEPEFQEKIFGHFQRLHSQEKYPGAGLGLAVSKKALARHGGRLWVDSTPNRSSTFYFSLPTAPHGAEG